eukprot:PhF_6_TR31717/c0_g1_i1/m.46675
MSDPQSFASLLKGAKQRSSEDDLGLVTDQPAMPEETLEEHDEVAFMAEPAELPTSHTFTHDNTDGMDAPALDDGSSTERSVLSLLLSGDNTKTVVSHILTYLGTAELVLGIKYVCQRLHAASLIEMKARLVSISYAPPAVRPVAPTWSSSTSDSPVARSHTRKVADILSSIRGDVITLTDGVAVRYDRELLETSAWSCEVLASLPAQADAPSYFFTDLSAAKQGYLVEGIMAGPVCQLLLPAMGDTSDEGNETAKSPTSPRGNKKLVKKSSAQTRDTSSGLRAAKIIGTFYVGHRPGCTPEVTIPRGSLSSSSHPSVSQRGHPAPSSRPIEMSPLPLLFKGTALLVVDQPAIYTSLATGTSVRAACTINLAIQGMYLSNLAPKAHTHAELAFGNSIIVSSRAQVAAAPAKTKVMFRQVTQGCLYIETQGTATRTQRPSSPRLATITATDSPSTQLVARAASVCVPPTSSFSYSSGEISSACPHITKPGDKIASMGFAAVPYVPLGKGGMIFAKRGRGLQTHLKDLINSAASPPLVESSSASHQTASIQMLATQSASLSEGSPDMCPPDAWAFPVAVYVDGFAAPTLFLPAMPLNTPVSELRAMINDLTSVSFGQPLPAASAPMTAPLPPLPSASSAALETSEGKSLPTWLPTGYRYTFNVYGSAALRALQEVAYVSKSA